MPSSAGLSIGLYTNEKNYFYNFGTIEKGKTILPTENTLYEIGSVAKTFTGFLLAKAVIEKKINLEDDIRNYLDGSYPNLEYTGNPIRIVHLANATAGIPDWLPPTPDIIKNAHPDSTSFLRERIYAKYTKEDFYTALHEAVIDTVPGTKRRHSNAGADLLMYILEKVYGMSRKEMVQKYILEPFKMNHTFFDAAGSKPRDLAKGYSGKGTLMPYLKGGVSSSASDLLEYMKIHLEGKNEIARLALTKTAYADLSSNKIVNRDTAVYSVALNWYSYKSNQGYSQTWYDGGTHGFSSYVVFYSELNTAIVLLANVTDQATFGKIRGIAYEMAEKIKQAHKLNEIRKSQNK